MSTGLVRNFGNQMATSEINQDGFEGLLKRLYCKMKLCYAELCIASSYVCRSFHCLFCVAELHMTLEGKDESKIPNSIHLRQDEA